MSAPPTDPRFPYGTQPKPNAPDTVYMVPPMLNNLLGLWKTPYAVLLQSVGTIPIPTYQLCAYPPPDRPWNEQLVSYLQQFAGVPTVAIAEFVSDLYKVAIWNDYCEAVPAPQPDLPPPEGATEPVLADPTLEDLPPLPAEATTSDLLYQLTAVLGYLRQVQSGQQGIGFVVDWMQRHMTVRDPVAGTPFNIAGVGQTIMFDAAAPFDTQHPVGALVEVTAYPLQRSRVDANPDVYYDAGWISFGVSGSAGTPFRIKRPNHTFWFGGLECFACSWSLPSGVTATVTPLLVPPLHPVVIDVNPQD
jgi:hypothetical protein